VNGRRLAGVVTVSLACVAGAISLSTHLAVAATAAPNPTAAVSIYSMTKNVQFCGSTENCRGGQYPAEITIVPDPDPGVQVIGVWVLPAGRLATTGIDHFHAIGAPDPAKPNTAVVRFLHPEEAHNGIFDYTVIVKYVKGTAPAG
jgi:hypothetical protein